VGRESGLPLHRRLPVGLREVMLTRVDLRRHQGFRPPGVGYAEQATTEADRRVLAWFRQDLAVGHQVAELALGGRPAAGYEVCDGPAGQRAPRAVSVRQLQLELLDPRISPLHRVREDGAHVAQARQATAEVDDSTSSRRAPQSVDGDRSRHPMGAMDDEAGPVRRVLLVRHEDVSLRVLREIADLVPHGCCHRVELRVWPGEEQRSVKAHVVRDRPAECRIDTGQQALPPGSHAVTERLVREAVLDGLSSGDEAVLTLDQAVDIELRHAPIAVAGLPSAATPSGICGQQTGARRLVEAESAVIQAS